MIKMNLASSTNYILSLLQSILKHMGPTHSPINDQNEFIVSVDSLGSDRLLNVPILKYLW